MSKADDIFIQNCKDILENGVSSEGQIVRPKWEDGTPAHTIKKFGIVNRYNLQEEFPALTIRRTPLKTAMDEILWIYQKKSNNIKDLNSHIWDSWADKNGSIGTAYGGVVQKKFVYGAGLIDQMDYVLKQLKESPFSRRIMTNLYQYDYLATGALDPCCFCAIYNVTEKNGERYLNLHLTQRSQDVLSASSFNVTEYAILLMMLAQVNNMKAGELVHCITDCHIYDRHIPIIEEIIVRETYPAPIVKLNPNVKNFYDFTTEDLIVENYQHGTQVKFPVAV